MNDENNYFNNMFCFSCVHFYFFNICRMELAMNMVFGLNVCFNARFMGLLIYIVF